MEELIEDGKDPVRLTEDFITFYRDLLFLHTVADQTELLEIVTPEEQFMEFA